MDPPVQAQVKQRYATLMEKRKAGASGDELGTAYGEYAMLLQAAEYYEAAEPAYLNAQDLMPRDVRWPYYLGHLYKSIGQTDEVDSGIHAGAGAQPVGDRDADLARASVSRAGQARRGRAVLHARRGAPAAKRRRARRASVRPRWRGATTRSAVSLLEEALALDPSARASIRRWPTRIAAWATTAQGRSASEAVAEHRHPRARSAAAGSRPRARERLVVRVARRAGAREPGLQGR